MKKLNKSTISILFLLVGLLLSSTAMNQHFEEKSFHQSQITSDLGAQVSEVGLSEVQVVQPISESPMPVYHLTSSRMFTILYLKLNFTGTTTLDGIQVSGQPTIIVDGSVFPIRSRYDEFTMFLTLSQGLHVISLVNIGVSGNAGAYELVFAHQSFIVSVGPDAAIPSFSPFQTSFELNVTFDPSREFTSDEAPLDQALISPTTIEGNLSKVTATLEGTGFIGDLSTPGPFPSTSGILLLQTADGIRSIPAVGTEETLGFGDGLPIANFISLFPIGYDPSSPYYANMVFFGADTVSFHGVTNDSSVTQPTDTASTVTSSSTTSSSQNTSNITSSEIETSSDTIPTSSTISPIGLPVFMGSVIMAIGTILLRRKLK
ncbi:MAG: hypothetical protein D6732_01300 [Methanobacteriota archaeon]|nr:MAG: hypothetical protein D6732_01300 [Euryarchaeota archaeon]